MFFKIPGNIFFTVSRGEAEGSQRAGRNAALGNGRKQRRNSRRSGKAGGRGGKLGPDGRSGKTSGRSGEHWKGGCRE